MTALCTWEHTYQSFCLRCSPALLRPRSFRLVRPDTNVRDIRQNRSSTRLVGIDCDDRCIFTDGGLKNYQDEVTAGWRIILRTPINRTCDLDRACDPRQRAPAFEGVTNHTKSTAETTCFFEASGMIFKNSDHPSHWCPSQVPFRFEVCRQVGNGCPSRSQERCPQEQQPHAASPGETKRCALSASCVRSRWKCW